MNLTTHPQSTPKVSVVVPCYNAAAFLTRAVNSIRNQTFRNWEMILVDDGSTDATPKVAQQLAQEDPRIRLLKHPTNRGVSAARNTGIAAARSEYVTLLDADDEYLPDYLKQATKILDEQTTVNLVFPSCVRITESGEIPHKMIENLTLLTDLEMGGLLACHTFRKSCWQKVGGFDERLRYAEDWHFQLKLNIHGLLRYVLLKEPLYRYNSDNKASIGTHYNFDRLKKSRRLIYDDLSQTYDEYMKPLFRRIIKRYLKDPEFRPRLIFFHPVRWAIDKKPAYWLLLRGIFLVKCAVYLPYLWDRICKRTGAFVLKKLRQR